MKRILFILSIFIFFDILNAEITNVTKINEFAFAQNFMGADSFIINDNYLYTRTTFGIECYEILDGVYLNKLSQVVIPSPAHFVFDDNYISN